MKKVLVLLACSILLLNCWFNVAFANQDEEPPIFKPKPKDNIWPPQQLVEGISLLLLVFGLLATAYLVGGSIMNYWSQRR